MVSRAAVLVAVAGILVAGCAGSGYHYVKNSDDKTYFKVPDKWRLYDEKTIIDRLGGNLSAQEKRAQRVGAWQVAFDGNPQPSLRHLADAGAPYPSGIAIVRQLTFDDADSTSLQSLRNYFFDIDGALDAQAATIRQYRNLQFDGGFHGIRMVAELQLEGGSVIDINQTAVVDQETSKVYLLLVTCDRTCYTKNRSAINSVVDSWTIKE
jgi:hypothetical protein